MTIGGSKVNKYVVGFLFDTRGHVALVNKNRPAWQKGRLNGIGGHIEPDETPEQAMVREFKEEAGCDILNWRQYCVVRGSEYELNLFTAKNETAEVRSVTDEMVGWYPVGRLPDNILPNLKWLIPMADYGLPIKAEIIHESETC
jgi:8-oxo-dGTP diphosphatase